MNSPRAANSFAGGRRNILLLCGLIALLVALLAWWLARTNRNDALLLLVDQGKAFTESLALSAANADQASRAQEQQVAGRFHLIASEFWSLPAGDVSSQVANLSLRFDLLGAFLYDSAGVRRRGSFVREIASGLPEQVEQEAFQLIAHPDSNYILQRLPFMSSGTTFFFYELSNDATRLLVLIGDASDADRLSEETGMGKLVQRMGEAEGIWYIIYQSEKGIIFSSRQLGSLPAFTSDTFLVSAAKQDSMSHRTLSFADEEVLEIVRPFSSGQYPFGVLRVGLSLDRYREVVRGYTQQLVILVSALFALMIVVVLFLDNRSRRLQAGRELEAIKSITDQIFDQMATGVLVVDSQGTIRQSNRSLEQHFEKGLTVGADWRKTGLESVLGILDFISSQQRTFDKEVTVISKSGSVKKLLIAQSRVLIDSKNVGAVMVTSDVTKLRELELQAQRKERLSELGSLAAGVAHEIRNPLNTIAIAGQRLAGEFRPNSGEQQYQEILRLIQDETRRLNDIVTRFLSLAREPRSSPKAIDMSIITSDLSTLWKVECNAIGIEFNSSVEANLMVAIDPDRYRELLTNLYVNAKEAVSGTSGKISISVVESENYAIIRVEDNGKGIADEVRRKLFTPYFTTKDAGTGLGLALVHRVVTEVSGEIEVGKSQLGGAEFTIYLPLAP